MDATITVDSVELGRYLAQLRERAGIKQVELARKVTFSPAVLSRIEGGERPLTSAELQTIVKGIGLPEGLKLPEAVQREWTFLPRPALDHPDQDLLWDAELVANDLISIYERPDVRSAFARRLSVYLSEIKQVAALLLKRSYQVAFIGSIGIGKSTAICRVTGLEIPGQDGAAPAPVLEAGAGGITVCEVHLRSGTEYGLTIEPRSDEDIRTDVTDFAEHVMRGNPPPPDEPQVGEGESQGISKEIERTLRNMSGLRIRREKTAEGKRALRDEAKELAQGLATIRELVVEVLARMELHKRDRRDVWYDAGCGKPPLVWLKETFEEVNNGRHLEFTLPRRIEVVVPDPLLGDSDLSIRIIDTKGIDRNAARADLEVHFEEPHTLTVLCSGFNNAPAAEPRLLLERASEGGVRSLDTHAALLMLPRPGEALAVKDETGMRVESAADGYELKAEQISMSLEPIRLAELPLSFFNAHQDDPVFLREFLNGRITAVRQTFRHRMGEITAQAGILLLNQEQEQVQAVIRHAALALKSWADQNANPLPPNAHVQDSLLVQMAKTYAATLRATIRREGEWPNFSYSHHLGYGARRVAVLSLGKRVEEFSALCKAMIGNPDFTDVQDLLSQSERVLLTAYEELLRKVQLMGQTSFRDELKLDSDFWLKATQEWGQGPGYRDRVAHRNAVWFGGERRQKIECELFELVEREWINALSRMTALLDNGQ